MKLTTLLLPLAFLHPALAAGSLTDALANATTAVGEFTQAVGAWQGDMASTEPILATSEKVVAGFGAVKEAADASLTQVQNEALSKVQTAIDQLGGAVERLKKDPIFGLFLGNTQAAKDLRKVLGPELPDMILKQKDAFKAMASSLLRVLPPRAREEAEARLGRAVDYFAFVLGVFTLPK